MTGQVRKDTQRIAIVGAGIGGLSAGLRLVAAGQDVVILEQHGQVGGKMRTLPTAAGPVDAGPTVMTMRPVFEDLFSAAGEKLSDHVTLTRQHILARHWWADGSSLDLFSDTQESARAIAKLSGAQDSAAFIEFTKRTRQLFEAFEAPMMRTAEPDQLALAKQILRQPSLLPAMAPLQSLAKSLARQFEDPRLRQLFGRYATYVGGSPYMSPALLGLIWQAEAAGVWTVSGGMHQLADAIARLFRKLGGEITLDASVRRLEFQGGRITGIALEDGRRVAADMVVFNGDPRALTEGLIGDKLTTSVPKSAIEPRSLSACVWSFAAEASGMPLVHHNVFFGDTLNREFDDLATGEMPSDPTLYVCAQDREDDALAPDGPERFEIIMNAPPRPEKTPEKEFEICHRRTFRRLAQM
ncbi:MAG: FAD-dependent oxidoreductase [Litoreibacter sp.]|nr:FAD-dependent oxidoreductase [Litoreibacter sp.]